MYIVYPKDTRQICHDVGSNEVFEDRVHWELKNLIECVFPLRISSIPLKKLKIIIRYKIITIPRKPISSMIPIKLSNPRPNLQNKRVLHFFKYRNVHFSASRVGIVQIAALPSATYASRMTDPRKLAEPVFFLLICRQSSSKYGESGRQLYHRGIAQG